MTKKLSKGTLQNRQWFEFSDLEQIELILNYFKNFLKSSEFNNSIDSFTYYLLSQNHFDLVSEFYFDILKIYKITVSFSDDVFLFKEFLKNHDLKPFTFLQLQMVFWKNQE